MLPDNPGTMLTSSRDQIRMAYSALCNTPIEECENPIRRAFLTITGDQEKLQITECYEEGDQQDDDAHGNVDPNRLNTNIVSEQLTVLQGQHRDVRREVRELKRELQGMKEGLTHSLRDIMAGINRIARAPAARQIDPVPGAVVDPDRVLNRRHIGPIALLSSKPGNLHVLWQEWESGTSGRKPAKDFTAHERGQCRHKYSRRKYVWGAVEKNIALGHDHMSAIDCIYQKYGRMKTVTQIINLMANEARALKEAALQEVMNVNEGRLHAYV